MHTKKKPDIFCTFNIGKFIIIATTATYIRAFVIVITLVTWGHYGKKLQDRLSGHYITRSKLSLHGPVSNNKKMQMSWALLWWTSLYLVAHQDPKARSASEMLETNRTKMEHSGQVRVSWNF